MKVHLRMLGCRLNQSEIDTMARQFTQQGHAIVDDPADADRVVVNTCAVTQQATASSRKLIREINRANPHAEITVTGCYAHIAPDDIAIIPGVTQVVDNLGKDTIVANITGQSPQPFDHEPFARDDTARNRTRAFVKVQDGCDNACTFCITTVARGQGRSRPQQEVIAEINWLVEQGYHEAVLTGVHLGSYACDLDETDGLLNLVQAILRETDLPRLRLSSLEPWDISPGFFDLWADSRLCPHLHLPLQSGCDATLRRMRRNTTQRDFAALVSAARAVVPDMGITTDVIVGFPGETEAEFADSRAFITAMDFARLHVFPYSRRPGTPAARMRHHLDKATKKARVADLMALSEAGMARYGEQFVGTTRPVLWEHVNGATEAGFINVGYTDNYVRVRSIHPRPLTNHLVPARLDSYDRDHQHATATPLIQPESVNVMDDLLKGE